MNSFDELVTARKQWLNEILRPWCQSARRPDLLKAEPDWVDIAGKVDPVKTLWLWAWSRFPDLVHESLGIEETSEVEIELRDGRVIRGFPDARDSEHGQLILWKTDATTKKTARIGPFSIDEIVTVQRRTETRNGS
jgi:hypothetical protein